MKKYTFKKILTKIIIPIVLLAIPFVVPYYIVEFDVSTLSSIFSLIFAILVGFFFATATTNYLNFQNYLADEGAYLISLYNLGKLVQPNVMKKLRDTIDAYYIAVLDYSLMEFAEKTRKEFQEVIDLLDTIEPTDDKKMRVAALSYMHETKSNLVKTFRSITFTSPCVIKGLHWFILIVLAVILSLLLLSLRTEEILSGIVTGFMILSLYLILFLLREVDNNNFLEEQLACEDAQSIFEAIGKPRYYPETTFLKGWTKVPSVDYRLGIYKNYPHSMEKKIKLVRKA